MAGGTIPGAEISFGGILGVGAVPDTKFPYYPFIGFSSIETNLANVAGTYNQLGYHQVPSQNFAPVAVDSKITINADGTWTECDNTGINAGKCQQPGGNFAQSADGSGAFQTNNFLGQAKPTLATTPEARGYMIVGKLRNQLVPILVRTGAANSSVTVPQNGALGPYADDESGISILAPQSAITVNSQNGEYIGVDSQFDYRTTALEGTEATLLDPFNASQASLATRAESGLHASRSGRGDDDASGRLDRHHADRKDDLHGWCVRLPRSDQRGLAVLHDRRLRPVTDSARAANPQRGVRVPAAAQRNRAAAGAQRICSAPARSPTRRRLPRAMSFSAPQEEQDEKNLSRVTGRLPVSRCARPASGRQRRRARLVPRDAAGFEHAAHHPCRADADQHAAASTEFIHLGRHELVDQ